MVETGIASRLILDGAGRTSLISKGIESLGLTTQQEMLLFLLFR